MILAEIIMVTLAFLFIAYPFYRQRVERHTAGPSGNGRMDDLIAQRDITYSMLKEVQFDYQSGLLTEEDYKDLESKYKARAISILKDMDKADRTADEEDEIEKRVLALRRSAGVRKVGDIDDEIEKKVTALRRTADVQKAGRGIDDEIEKRVAALRGKKERFCPGCGEARHEGARFCSYCGERLNPEVETR